MAKKILIIMDLPSTVNPDKDTTFAIGEEASRRGHKIFYATIHDIFLQGSIPWAKNIAVTFVRDHEKPLIFSGEKVVSELNEFDFILMRKDPPFDARFIFICQFLRLVPGDKVINDPTGIILAQEKIYPLRFPGIFPPTWMGSDFDMLEEFAAKNGKIILKPIDGNGGRGILLTEHGDRNLRSMFEVLSHEGTQPIIAQLYLPAVREGDVRIILLDGKPVGAVNRMPSNKEHRANLHVGGQAIKHLLTPRQIELCNAIGELLKKDGLYFTGIDVIGDYITEINVTSPTGIQEIKDFGGEDIAALFWKNLGC